MNFWPTCLGDPEDSAPDLPEDDHELDFESGVPGDDEALWKPWAEVTGCNQYEEYSGT